ncbi:MAG: 16S rRNA (cytosine(1402)-N(4))-methyltransferase RsmH [Thermoflexales bacterium]
MVTTTHIPVLFDEVMQLLQPRSGGRYLDCTLGGGGHTAGLLQASAPDGIVLAADADASAIARAKVRFATAGSRLILRQCWLDELPDLADALELAPFDGILADLGLCSDQLEDPARGFSFTHDGPLDMRFNPQQSMSAAEWLQHTDLPTLTRVLREYGELPRADVIARAIWQARPIRTTSQLRDVVQKLVRRRNARLHPATLVFQALRIAINDELQRLARALPRLIAMLHRGGRLAVISFHSLEDRIVKQCFRASASGTAQAERDISLPATRLITRRPLVPTSAEVARNPRARSAKLRVVERL